MADATFTVVVDLVELFPDATGEANEILGTLTFTPTRGTQDATRLGFNVPREVPVMSGDGPVRVELLHPQGWDVPWQWRWQAVPSGRALPRSGSFDAPEPGSVVPLTSLIGVPVTQPDGTTVEMMRGAPGRGIESITDPDGDGTATITYSDGATESLPLPGPKVLKVADAGWEYRFEEDGEVILSCDPDDAGDRFELMAADNSKAVERTAARMMVRARWFNGALTVEPLYADDNSPVKLAETGTESGLGAEGDAESGYAFPGGLEIPVPSEDYGPKRVGYDLSGEGLEGTIEAVAYGDETELVATFRQLEADENGLLRWEVWSKTFDRTGEHTQNPDEHLGGITARVNDSDLRFYGGAAAPVDLDSENVYAYVIRFTAGRLAGVVQRGQFERDDAAAIAEKARGLEREIESLTSQVASAVTVEQGYGPPPSTGRYRAGSLYLDVESKGLYIAVDSDRNGPMWHRVETSPL